MQAHNASNGNADRSEDSAHPRGRAWIAGVRAAVTLAMLSPLSREASVGMLFTKATHGEKSIDYAKRRG
jgi:hypothetical protein